MMRLSIFTLLSGILFLTSCSGSSVHGPVKPSADGKTVVIDVRTTAEWNNGHKDCAVNYPLDELQNHEQELSTYDTVYFVCQSGGRAQNATNYMQGKGGKTIYLNAGSWQDLGCR